MPKTAVFEMPDPAATAAGMSPQNPIDFAGSERVATDLAAFLASGGQVETPAPMLAITTRGRTSGLWHRTVIFYAPDGDNVLVFGSNMAGAKHPQWYLNLLADPTVYAQVTDAPGEMFARELTGSERDAAWLKLITAFPPYVSHQEKVQREIGIAVLVPVPA